MNKHFELFFQSDRTAYDLAIQRNVIVFKVGAYHHEDLPGSESTPWEDLREIAENLEAMITDRYHLWLASILNTASIPRDSAEAYEIYDQMSGFMDTRIPIHFLVPDKQIHLLDPPTQP